MHTPEPTAAARPDHVVEAFAARIRRSLDAAAGDPRQIMIIIIGAAAACWMTDRAAFRRGHALALADLALEYLGMPAAQPAAPAPGVPIRLHTADEAYQAGLITADAALAHGASIPPASAAGEVAR